MIPFRKTPDGKTGISVRKSDILIISGTAAVTEKEDPLSESAYLLYYARKGKRKRRDFSRIIYGSQQRMMLQ